MSIRLWEEIARQKEETEKQRENILNTFKEHKVAQEMGSMKAEKLFRPITKRLEPSPEAPQAEREDFYAGLAVDPLLDHQIGDQMANLFDDGQEFDELGEVKPGAEDFPPDLGEEVPPGEKASPKRWSSAPDLPSYSQVPPTYTSRDESSKKLSILNKFLKNNKGKTDAVLKTGGRELSYMEVQDEVDNIYAQRAYDMVVDGISPGKKDLGPFTGKSHKQIREMLGIAEEHGKPEPPTKKKTGKGVQRAGGMPRAEGLQSLTQRLSLGISSIFAGNSSLKLREEVKAIAKLLFKNGVLSQEQKNKVLSLK